MRGNKGRELRAFSVIGLVFVLIGAGVLIALPGKSWNQVTRYYGDVQINGNFANVYFDDIWDLTKGDLVMTYTIDMTGVNSRAPSLPDNKWANTSWTSVGLDGIGWMASGAPEAYATNPNSLDLDDKHNLGAPGRYDEASYDVNYSSGTGVLVPPKGWSWASSYGFWFDRDGVDATQKTMWGCIDGGTYNTRGQYAMSMNYHATNPASGMMSSLVNGTQPGFWKIWSGVKAPNDYPWGKSINGDLTNVRVWIGLWSPHSLAIWDYGSVRISDLTVQGYLATKDVRIDVKPDSSPNSICLKDNGLLPVAILGASDLDVYDIDPESLQAGVDPLYVDIATRGPAKAPKLAYSFADVNQDGVMDMMVFFEVQALVLDGGLNEHSTQLSVTGELYNDVPIKGVDSVAVVP